MRVSAGMPGPVVLGGCAAAVLVDLARLLRVELDDLLGTLELGDAGDPAGRAVPRLGRSVGKRREAVRCLRGTLTPDAVEVRPLLLGRPLNRDLGGPRGVAPVLALEG